MASSISIFWSNSPASRIALASSPDCVTLLTPNDEPERAGLTKTTAVAAQVLADDLGIPTENTAKWLDTHEHTGHTFTQGQLVIVDEASLAGTLSFDRITGLAAEAGAKVLLAGDYAQLHSVDAGGAFSMLVHDREDVPELVDVHRFTNEWEKTASLGLRHGRTEVIDTYLDTTGSPAARRRR